MPKARPTQETTDGSAPYPMNPETPNQTLERTASRRFTQLSMISTFQSAARRAVARGSSSLSR